MLGLVLASIVAVVRQIAAINVACTEALKTTWGARLFVMLVDYNSSRVVIDEALFVIVYTVVKHVGSK